MTTFLLRDDFITDAASLIFSDAFTRVDGSIGNGWTDVGGTWTIVGNKLINTPTLGSELFLTGDFSADVNWSKGTGWTIAAGVASHAAGSTGSITQNAATIGLWYREQMTITSISGGNVSLRIGGFNPLFVSSPGTYLATARADSAAAGATALSAAVASVDNATLKQMTLSTLFATRNFGRSDADVLVKLTIVSGNACGLVLNLDSTSAPANFVIASHDGVTAKLEKCVAGVYTTLISITTTYVAGAVLEAKKVGTTCQLFYNGAQVGTDQPISDAGIISNTIHGMFSAYEGNSLDDFSNSITSRTAEPGPGTLIITDAGQVVSVSSGMLQIGAVRAGVGDPALWGAGIARASGLAVVSVVSSPTTNVVLGIGFDINQSGALSIGTYLAGGTEVRALSAAGQISSTNIYAAGIKKTAVVARAVGELCFFHNGTNWILIWVDVVDIQTTLYPSMTAFGGGTAAALAIDTFRALQLPAPFNTDFGLATQRLSGARSVSDTFTHTADCVLEWAQTTLNAGGTTLVFFRKQDSTNYWQIMITAVGDFRLYEIVAGTPTQRATAAAVILSGHRIVIVADGTTIRGYSNNILRWTYATATNFQTATAGELNSLGTSGAISDIVTWPRQITGVPASILDAAVGGSGDLTATLGSVTLSAVGLSWQPTFLLRDEFSTPTSAPLTSPRTAEPGPGTLTVADPGNNISVSAGKLSTAINSVGAWTTGVQGASRSRAAGLATILKLDYNGVALTSMFGWSSAIAGNFFTHNGFRLAASNIAARTDSDPNSPTLLTMTNGQSYILVCVLSSTGCLLLIKDLTAGSWIFAWRNPVDATASLKATLSSFSVGTAPFLADMLRDLALPAPYVTDYGLATTRLAGARANGDSFTHVADCVIEYIVTTLPTTAHQVAFRSQDSSNEWFVRHGSTGDISLFDRVAGVTTSRISAVGVLANGHRVVVIADGNTIRLYSNNVLRGTYASAFNFATATAGRIAVMSDGAISDIVTWPRTLSSVAAAILDVATIPYTAAQSTATLADATLAAAGKLAIGGQIASTLADATLAAVGLHGITAQLAVTLADVAEVSSAKVKISGQITVSLASAVLAASGRLSIKAQLNVPLNSVKLEAYNHPIEIISGTIYGPSNTGFVFGQQIQGEVMGI